MDKNPISFLQEQLIRKQILPCYTVIESKNGTHLNWFKIRVVCGTDLADGEGSSKKDAKTNAAIAMINLLGLNSCNYIQAAPMKIITDSQPIQPSQSTPFTNYVGKLQEMAMQKDIPLPVYINQPMRGPPHNPQFTTVCKFINFEEEATSSNKKESKTLAAKKMFERVNTGLQLNDKPIKLETYLDTIDSAMADLQIHTQNKNAMAESAQRALMMYLPLSRINAMKKVNLQEERSYNDFHTFLRDSYSDEDRGSVMDKLQDTIKMCGEGNNVSKPMNELKSALQILNIDVKEVKYTSQNKSFIIGLQLDTNPVISEIGCGATKLAAELQSIVQMALTVSIMIA